MASTDASFFPVKGQACRLSGHILNWSTGQVITGGLTTLAASVSKDGAAFASVTSAPAEIGTTGFYTLDLSATEMNANTVIVKVTEATANSADQVFTLYPVDLSETATAAGDASVKRPEQFLAQAWGRWMNKHSISGSTFTLYKRDGSTTLLSATVNETSTPSHGTMT